MKKSLGAKAVVYPTPVFVVGTYNDDGRPNVATAAWSGICCSSPPCIAVSLRKATLTYENIMAREVFTVNVPSEDYVVEVDFFGIAQGRKVDKFVKTGLTAVRSPLVEAPYIKEFPFILECRLMQSVELGLHTQFIGEILNIEADESICREDGVIDVEKVRPLVYSPEIRRYFGLGKYLGDSFSIGKKLK